MALEVRDLGIGKLREQLKQLGRLKVTLGVQGEAAAEQHPKANVPVGLLAFWLHFGTETPDGEVKMPARPWVDRAIDEIRSRAGVAGRKAISDLIDRRAADPVEALEAIGVMGVEAVRQSIDDASSWAEPLATSTVARKGHSRPLVDTETVKNASSYAIRDGDKILKQGGAEG